MDKRSGALPGKVKETNVMNRHRHSDFRNGRPEPPPASGLAAQGTKEFAHILEPVLRHGHDGVVTAVGILGPADDVVTPFAVPADGDVAVLENGHGGGHAGAGLWAPGTRVVGVLVVEAD